MIKEQLRDSLVLDLGELDVKPVDSVAALFELTSTGYLLNPKLQIEHHFEPALDCLIHDNSLGVLGLVQIIDGQKDTKQGLAKVIANTVDQATYMRHLLLMACENQIIDAQNDSRIPRPFSVELVLITTETHMPVIGNALREIVSETDYLYSIGINVLPYSETNDDEGKARRRAFSWLLRETNAWYVTKDAQMKAKNKMFNTVEALTVDNYRLYGERALNFDPKAQIHLVHGQNGSGKSALVEALELVVTGSVDRLEQGRQEIVNQALDYSSTIQNHDANSPATIKLTFKESDEIGYEVTDKTQKRMVLKPSVPLGINANSFRLDQTVMDKLTRLGNDERAKVFLDAFFPEEKPKVDQHYIAERAVDEHQRTLDDLVKESDLVDDKNALPTFIKEFSWLGEEGSLITSAAERFLPFSLDILQALLPRFTEITEQVTAWEQKTFTVNELPDRLKIMDDLLRQIRPFIDSTVQQLEQAYELLGSLKNWSVTGAKIAGDDFSEALNSWLENHILADLADKQVKVSLTLLEADQRNWKADSKIVNAIKWPSEGETNKLAEHGQVWNKERDIGYQQVMSMYEHGPRSSSGSQLVRPTLTIQQINNLDKVGHWLFDITLFDAAKPFGQLLQTAIIENKRVKIGDEALGNKSWTTKIEARITRLLNALEILQKANNKNTWKNSSQRFSNTQALLAKYKEWQVAGEALAKATALMEQSFIKRIDKLNAPLNELMALFTPARWAYKDIALSHLVVPEEKGNKIKHQVAMRIAGEASGDASLIFNTAELNLFTLALFLLCARRVKNPYHVLVWDDPLQNMDELTATTLARGLAKVNQLWRDDDWQMLLFFHGKDDLERFRGEVPAAVYSLPWLSPAVKDKAPQIKRQDNPFSYEFQRLDKLIVELPK